MKIEFLSVLLLCSLCQAFPATSETETYTATPQNPPNCGFVRKCCEKLHLAGDKSMFKDIYVSTGTDYKPPPKSSGRRRSCCQTKHPEDTQQPQSNTTVAEGAVLGMGAYEVGKAQGEHGLVPDMGATDGVALGVDGGTGVGAVATGGGGGCDGGVECGGCGDGTVECLCFTAKMIGGVLKFFCCDVPGCLCGCCGNCDCPM